MALAWRRRCAQVTRGVAQGATGRWCRRGEGTTCRLCVGRRRTRREEDNCQRASGGGGTTT
uniref:Uncharacterized protein n=1 Tax=Setaria italica TaxID=4555 RepID=K4AHU2_SETIT